VQTNARMTIPKGWIEGEVVTLATITERRLLPAPPRKP
jgi:hypothetical protein